jgi:hypothetical protein
MPRLDIGAFEWIRTSTVLLPPDPQVGASVNSATTLRAALLFAQFFGAPSDSLEHFFHLALLRGRDILKCTFDEGGVLAEDRKEHPPSLLRKRNRPYAAIALAFHTTNQPLLMEPIDRHADRSGVEVYLRADHVNGQRPFVQQNFKDSEIRFPQARLENGRESKVTDGP